MLLEPSLVEILNEKQNNWRTVGATSIQNGIPIPVMSSSLNYFDGLRSKRLPANLIQAQRDFFGAHGYEKVTAPRGTIFHLEDK